jgi:nucleoid DNA-binding protein
MGRTRAPAKLAGDIAAKLSERHGLTKTAANAIVKDLFGGRGNGDGVGILTELVQEVGKLTLVGFGSFVIRKWHGSDGRVKTRIGFKCGNRSRDAVEEAGA